MKKFILFYTIFISIVSCTTKFDETILPDIETYQYSYTGSSMENDEMTNVTPESKMNFEALKKDFTWSTGDKTMIFYTKEGLNFDFIKDVNNSAVPFIARTSGHISDFFATGCTNIFDKDSKYIYKSFFPFPTQAVKEAGPIPYTIPTEQTAAFDPSYCLMYDEVVDAPALIPGQDETSGNELKFNYKHLLTYLAFYIKDPDKKAPVGYQINALEIEFPTNISVVGDITIDPRNNEKGVTVNNIRTSNRVVLKFEDPITPTDVFSQDKCAILAALPFELNAGDEFKVTIKGQNKSVNDIRQTIICAPIKGMSCKAGHFRKIGLILTNDYIAENKVVPEGGGGMTIQEMIDNQILCDIEYKRGDIYHNLIDKDFVRSKMVVSAGSRVMPVGNEGTDKKDNVIILENMENGANGLIGTQSAFYMPVKTVIPNFWDPTFNKDIKIKFKYHIACSSWPDLFVEKPKEPVPLIIANDHCNTNTHKWFDSGYEGIETVNLPKENVRFNTKELVDYRNSHPDGHYPPVPAGGWDEYSGVIPYESLNLYKFMDKDNETHPYVGFKLDNRSEKTPNILLYIKDIEIIEVNCRPINAWMKKIPGNCLLSDMSLPGTHDAATWTLQGSKDLQCQTIPIINQLKEGVRVLDLRPSANVDLWLNHGTTSTGITLASAIEYIEKFLKMNQSETVIVTLKNEQGNDDDWSRYIRRYLDSMEGHEVVPGKKLFAEYHPGITLDEVRGQLLILSRNDYTGSMVGGKIKQWSDATESEKTTISNSGNQSETLWVQDDYKANVFNNLIGQVKSALIKKYLEKSKTKPANEWLFNYLTVTSVGSIDKSVKDYAVELNKTTYDHLLQNPGKTGVVFMDFAGDGSANGSKILKLIIDQNFIGNKN